MTPGRFFCREGVKSLRHPVKHTKSNFMSTILWSFAEGETSIEPVQNFVEKWKTVGAQWVKLVENAVDNVDNSL